MSRKSPVNRQLFRKIAAQAETDARLHNWRENDGIGMVWPDDLPKSLRPFYKGIYWKAVGRRMRSEIDADENDRLEEAERAQEVYERVGGVMIRRAPIGTWGVGMFSGPIVVDRSEG